MINNEVRENEELKDVLTAISVVAKRLRDRLTDARETNEPCDNIDVINKASHLINAYSTLGDLRTTVNASLYRHSGAPEHKDFMDGCKKANDWYTSTRRDILETIVSLGDGSDMSHADDLISQVNKAREQRYKEMVAECMVPKDKSMEDKMVMGHVVEGSADDDMFPEYEAVKNRTLLGSDGTLQLKKYSDENVEFSRDYCALEGALQDDHNKRVEIYEIVSSMSPVAYVWGKRTRADLLRQLADEIEMAETLS